MADAGTIAAFGDFMTATRQLPMSSPDKIVNQMTRHNTYLTKLMMAGLGADDFFQGGTEIVEQLQLKYTSNSRNYLPTDTQAPTGTDSLTQGKWPWRFKLVDSVWYDHEIILNNESDTRTVFKRLAKAKRQKMYTDFFDAINDDLWAAPDATNMEGGNSSGTKPYSLRCYFTIGTGVPNTTAVSSNGDGATGAGTWSTVAQINPTNYPNWDNQRVTYDSTDILGTLEDALDDMYIRLNWESPDSRTGMQDTKLDKLTILTNREGYKNLVKLARLSRSATDDKGASNLGWANGIVTYHGRAVKYISALDSTDITPAGKPRYYFANFNHIKLVFHKNRYLAPKTFSGTVSQPFANVEYRDTWWNLICTNRREQGLVYAA